MLLPCGIDVFSGVEFVCCPKKQQQAKKGDDITGLPSALDLLIFFCVECVTVTSSSHA